ncbi:MAG: hypothetical protein RL685_7224 [Pseudomonadota bacterium]
MIRNKAPLAKSSGGTFSSLPARRSTASLFALFGLGLLGSWIASCKDDDSQRACIPGETRQCAGAGRCVGTQACLADGSDYAACDCSGPPRQGTMEPEPGEVVTALVGRRCVTDTNCGEGLSCYTDASNALLGGGAAGGYCTVACTGDTACAAIDPDSRCSAEVTGSPGVCMRTCFSSPGSLTAAGAQARASLAENKCLNRPDLVCLSEAALGLAMFSGSRQSGWCFPQCGSNEECPGRRCDLSRGVCVDTPAAGLELGARCASAQDCTGGLCIAADAAGAESFCSAPCVLGQPVGCGYGPTAAVREAGCLGPRFGGFLSDEGIGDSGFCAELCDVDADCVQAASRGWTCTLSDGARERFRRGGICGPPRSSDAGTDAGDAATPLDASSGG